jgi:hypothetical protein
MNIIPPITITDAMFDSATVTEPSTAESADPNYAGEWASGQLYSVNQIVLVVSEHKLYQSLQNGNIGQTPGVTGNETWWLDYGSSEQWSVFDGKVGSQATGTGGAITYNLDPTPFDSVALLNIEATSISVTVTDVGGSGEPIVWTETTYASGFYTSDVVSMDFSTAYLTPHVVIVITHSSGTAKIGEIVIGQKKAIGFTNYSPTVGITDYSTKEVDAFGNYTVLERTYSKRLSCQTTIENTDIDAVYQTLASVRAVPVVWVGSELYSTMIVYGFFKDFTIEIPYPSVSMCSLEIEGLV